MIAQEAGEFLAILGIFVNTQLEVFRELFKELFELFFVFRDFTEKLHTLFDDVLANDLENLALLQSFTRDVQRQIFAVHYTFHEVCKTNIHFISYFVYMCVMGLTNDV